MWLSKTESVFDSARWFPSVVKISVDKVPRRLTVGKRRYTRVVVSLKLVSGLKFKALLKLNVVSKEEALYSLSRYEESTSKAILDLISCKLTHHDK